MAKKNAKSKVGRRSKYTPELEAEICKYISEGLSAVDACGLSGIGERTFFRWKNNNVNFVSAIKKAELIHKKTAASTIINAGQKTWQAAAWWLERKYPDEFALKPKILNNNINGEADIADLENVEKWFAMFKKHKAEQTARN